MQREFPIRSITKEHASTLSRRQFLFAGAALAVGTGHPPSLVDELTSFLDKGIVSPVQGESSPPDFEPPKQKASPDSILEKNRYLFLTFDDGPLPCTGKILDLLGQTHHKITFFVIGRNLLDPKLRDLAIRALREGHDLGNHSFSHPYFSRLSAKQAEKEITATHTLIEEVVKESGMPRDRQNRFFRFPYGVDGSGSTHRACHEVLAALGYQIAWWDLDTNDWRMELAWFPRPVGKVVAALTKAKPQDVVLLHDRSKTARYLPQLIAVLETHQLVSLPLSRYASLFDEFPLNDQSPAPRREFHAPDADDLDDLSTDFLKRLEPWNDNLERLIRFDPDAPPRKLLW